MNDLQSHSWPGNVRELENAVERGVILSRNGILTFSPESFSSHPQVKGSMSTSMKTHERQVIENALAISKGKISGNEGAAHRLGIPPSTLEFRIRKLGINKFLYR